MIKYICTLVTFILLSNVNSTIIRLPRRVIMKTHYSYLNSWERYSHYPYITGDTYRASCKHIIDETRVGFDPKMIKEGDSIFLNSWYAKYFFSKIHPKIKVRYVLLTTNGWGMLPGPYKQFLDEGQISAWLTVNTDMPNHPKVHAIPLGTNHRWRKNHYEVLDKYVKLSQSTADRKKSILCYVNFEIRTNPNHRQAVWDHFNNLSFITAKEPTLKLGQYFSDVVDSKFIISPHGDHPDCMRTMEALLLGCIPIILKSTVSKAYNELPVLVVNDWSEVTEEFLKLKYEEIQDKLRHGLYNMKKIHADYWIDLIKDYERKTRNGEI
ncbi:MAG: hypothetical protein S4CHLAM37_13340 [Chlamydiia bacterium]|nr:hypothetical protein [Chlamydiia bacterium]